MDVREVRTFEIDAIRAFEKVPINLGSQRPPGVRRAVVLLAGFSAKTTTPLLPWQSFRCHRQSVSNLSGNFPHLSPLYNLIESVLYDAQKPQGSNVAFTG